MTQNQIAKPKNIGQGHWTIDVLTDNNKEITITTTESDLVDKINYDEDWSYIIAKIESYISDII